MSVSIPVSVSIPMSEHPRVYEHPWGYSSEALPLGVRPLLITFGLQKNTKQSVRQEEIQGRGRKLIRAREKPALCPVFPSPAAPSCTGDPVLLGP